MRTVIRLALVGLLATQVACSDDSDSTPNAAGPDDPALAAMLETRYGVRVTPFDDGDSVREVTPDGEAYFAGKLWVDVEGLGMRILTYEETVHPAATGGAVFLRLEDELTGELRFFEYSVADNYIDFGQELGDDGEIVLERGAGVSRRSDGKYAVLTFDDTQSVEGEQVVDTGLEALRLVEEFADFGEVTPHIKLAAVALGHAPIPEARIPPMPDPPPTMEQCVEFYRTQETRPELWLADPMPEPYFTLRRLCDGLGIDGSMAARPSFCSVFTAFCDCAACTANPNAAGCSECQGL